MAGRPPSAAAPSATLFVADLPTHLTEQEFVAVFGAAAGFTSSRLRKDRSSKTIGFVEFCDVWVGK